MSPQNANAAGWTYFMFVQLIILRWTMSCVRGSASKEDSAIPYHPQTNGLVAKLNRMIQRYILFSHFEWNLDLKNNVLLCCSLQSCVIIHTPKFRTSSCSPPCLPSGQRSSWPKRTACTIWCLEGRQGIPLRCQKSKKFSTLRIDLYFHLHPRLSNCDTVCYLERRHVKVEKSRAPFIKQFKKM